MRPKTTDLRLREALPFYPDGTLIEPCGPPNPAPHNDRFETQRGRHELSAA